jgi:ribose/xylose/arabinose/galactoside ABC-type transport system permease subunit
MEALDEPIGAEAGGRARAGVRRHANVIARMSGLWVTIAIVMLVFWSFNQAFLSGPNLLSLVRATSTLAIVALGQTLVIVSGELDLSIGSVYALAPTVMAVLWINDHSGIWVALLGGLFAGVAVGLVNAFLTSAVKIPSFIVTLGTLSLVAGLAQQVGGAKFFTPAFVSPPLPAHELAIFNKIGASSPFGIPAQVLWLIGSSIFFAFLLHLTLYGFRLFAIGGNPTAARVARLPVARYRTIAFVLCGLGAALAGIIDFSFIGATQATVSGSSLTFPVFAAVIIGGASLSGGSGTVLGTLTGALLLGVLSNGLALTGVGGGYQQIFTGAITIAAVALDRWSGRIRAAVSSLWRRARPIAADA